MSVNRRRFGVNNCSMTERWRVIKESSVVAACPVASTCPENVFAPVMVVIALTSAGTAARTAASAAACAVETGLSASLVLSTFPRPMSEAVVGSSRAFHDVPLKIHEIEFSVWVSSVLGDAGKLIAMVCRF